MFLLLRFRFSPLRGTRIVNGNSIGPHKRREKFVLLVSRNQKVHQNEQAGASILLWLNAFPEQKQNCQRHSQRSLKPDSEAAEWFSHNNLWSCVDDLLDHPIESSLMVKSWMHWFFESVESPATMFNFLCSTSLEFSKHENDDWKLREHACRSIILACLDTFEQGDQK